MPKKKQAAQAVTKDREVTVQWDNVWTSKGKAYKGDEITLTAEEIKELGGAVK